jgi:hypothetical protein
MRDKEISCSGEEAGWEGSTSEVKRWVLQKGPVWEVWRMSLLETHFKNQEKVFASAYADSPNNIDNNKPSSLDPGVPPLGTSPKGTAPKCHTP